MVNRSRRTVDCPTPRCVRSGRSPFGAYVHVPFCATRCGYCDFNTYTSGEMQGTTQQQYVGAVLAEINLARQVVPHAPPLSTVFFGGGTPTLLAGRRPGVDAEGADRGLRSG